MKHILTKLVNFLADYFNLGQALGSVGGEQQEFLERVRQAHRDWEIALNNFNYTDDPDMIDFSIYNIEATEKKYTCLIKIARKEKIKANLDFTNTDQVVSISPDC